MKKIDGEMTRLGKPHEFHMLRGRRPRVPELQNAERHRPKQAADAWEKMLGFLDQQLKNQA